MKIALCSDYFYPRIGGVTSHILGLATELQKQGHDITIITKKTNDNGFHDFHEIEGIRIREVTPLIPCSNLIVPPNTTEIRRLFKREDFDIIHAHHAFTPTSLLSIAAAKKLNIPAVLTNHTIPFRHDNRLWSFAAPPVKKYVNKADGVIAVSNAAANFIEHFTPKKNIVIIPNGVDTDRFNSPEKSNITEKPTILYVGRLVYRKGLHVLIRAMPYVLRKIPDAQLLIAGNGHMKCLIELLIKRYGLEKHVKLLGFVPDKNLPMLYYMCNVFVLPSLHGESFGVTLLEAMASGKPIVASNVGGIPEVIEDDVTGLLVKKDSEKELADAISKILIDPNLAKILANNARKSVEKYSWTHVTEKVEKVYREVS